MSTQTLPMDTDHVSQTKQIFHIGTRASLLARVQTDEVVHALQKVSPHHNYQIHALTTKGDNNQKTALHKFNDKALWTQELEDRLLDGELDLIVHSLKDMPTQLPHSLELGCVTKRKDPRDALVVKPSLAETCRSLEELPEGAVIGTSSLRRIAQLKRYYPHLKFADVRGNIGTRLAKLDNPDSEYSAIILAVCGLLRMGMGERITSYLSKSHGGMLYSVGQGALGIETRQDDLRVQELLRPIECETTTRRVLAERSLMRTLEGGCSVPIGVETEWLPRKKFLTESSGVGINPGEEYNKLTGVATNTSESSTHEQQNEHTAESNEDDDSDEMIMRAVVVGLEGDEVAEVETRKIVQNREQADQFGRDVARLLVEKGADKILEKILLNRSIIQEQGEA